MRPEEHVRVEKEHVGVRSEEHVGVHKEHMGKEHVSSRPEETVEGGAVAHQRQ